MHATCIFSLAQTTRLFLQLDRMPDARSIGYSGMLGESALSVLVIIICCSSGLWMANYGTAQNGWGAAFIPGAAGLLDTFIPTVMAQPIVVVLVVSFAATTLDSGMRILRVLIGELGRTVEGVAPMLGKGLQNIFIAVCPSSSSCSWASTSSPLLFLASVQRGQEDKEHSLVPNRQVGACRQYGKPSYIAMSTCDPRFSSPSVME